MRVTYLTIMPSPYTRDLFAAIEADGRITPRVLYMEMEAPDTHWGQVPLPESAEVLSGGWKNLAGGRIHWNPGVIRAISRSRPDLVVVAGYSSLTCQVAMRWLRWRRIPWVFWGEVPGMRSRSTWGGRLRKWAMRPALRWPSAIAAIGSGAVEEYRRLASEESDVVNIPYHTDLGPFLREARQPATSRVRLFYCGQLIERKGVDLLLDAFLALADEFPQLELVLAGDGPLRQPLAERVPSRRQNRIDFAGFQPVERLPHYFAAADIFVLPSLHDGWGVVVNQALAAGLPIICSSAVGAAADLVTPGWNGSVVPPGNVAALGEAIRALACDACLRETFGQNSRQRAGDWTLARGVDRWVELAERVLARRADVVTRVAGQAVADEETSVLPDHSIR